jgi:hypothetical protein
MVPIVYNVVARPWRDGWELDIENVGVTQSPANLIDVALRGSQLHPHGSRVRRGRRHHQDRVRRYRDCYRRRST